MTSSAGLPISTAFPGIGATEHAVDYILRVMVYSFGLCGDVSIPALAAIDGHAESRAELKLSPLRPRHLYCGICSFLSEATQSAVRTTVSSNRLSLGQYEGLMFQNHVVKLDSWREMCGTDCVHPRASVHIAGTPSDHCLTPAARRAGSFGAGTLECFC